MDAASWLDDMHAAPEAAPSASIAQEPGILKREPADAATMTAVSAVVDKYQEEIQRLLSEGGEPSQRLMHDLMNAARGRGLSATQFGLERPSTYYSPETVKPGQDKINLKIWMNERVSVEGSNEMSSGKSAELSFEIGRDGKVQGTAELSQFGGIAYAFLKRPHGEGVELSREGKTYEVGIPEQGVTYFNMDTIFVGAILRSGEDRSIALKGGPVKSLELDSIVEASVREGRKIEQLSLEKVENSRWLNLGSQLSIDIEKVKEIYIDGAKISTAKPGDELIGEIAKAFRSKETKSEAFKKQLDEERAKENRE
jgi:hypothetical protein